MGRVLGLKLRGFQDTEKKVRETKAASRSYPGTLGSDAAGPPRFGWFLGLQLPESLVGDRANSFDCPGQSFGSKITRFSGHGEERQGNQSRESELPWDSRFGRGGSPSVRVVPRPSTAWKSGWWQGGLFRLPGREPPDRQGWHCGAGSPGSVAEGKPTSEQVSKVSLEFDFPGGSRPGSRGEIRWSVAWLLGTGKQGKSGV